ALFLNRFFKTCPTDRETHITKALHQANEIIVPHCHYFSIAQGIRHQARELLVGCFRMARGRGMRGERRFLEHPCTPRSLELFRLWAQVKPELAEMVSQWEESIKSPAPQPDQEKKKRPRRRRRGPKRAQGRGSHPKEKDQG
ncbi:MAG TPA: CCA tRNA nucleotidyltransferase, partial [Geopsychrobacteraceae bacterium]|nr:CCA tRNA nucleotidyltransferase [Geopsychrobacteraceae bacterium]